MADSTLRLRFFGDAHGFGELLAEASAKPFAGQGSAYLQIADIQEFADQIAKYPLTSGEPISISGRYFSSGEPNLSIQVYPISLRGYVGVRVHLASEINQGQHLTAQNKASIEIVTTYEPLKRFSDNLKALVHGQVAEIVLNGESFRE